MNIDEDMGQFLDIVTGKEFVAMRKWFQSLYRDDVSVKPSDLPRDTQALLRNIAKEEGPGVVTKEDLSKYGTDDNIWDKAFSPYGQIKNTLGQFTVNEDGTVTDTYDWSPEYKSMPYFGKGFRNTLGKIAYEWGRSQEGNVRPYTMDLNNEKNSIPSGGVAVSGDVSRYNDTNNDN